MSERDLNEGELKRVDANGYPVLLIRRSGNIHAIGARCSHAGAPLEEGKLEGDALTCPWHRSRFNIENGKVLDGPATYPLPCFEARVQGGQIEIRNRAN
jgi:nitrite reductase/ring-hydroxylating ferredoxin subunit